jgi:hypothetical protein
MRNPILASWTVKNQHSPEVPMLIAAKETASFLLNLNDSSPTSAHTRFTEDSRTTIHWTAR